MVDLGHRRMQHRRRCVALGQRRFELVAPRLQLGDLLAEDAPGRAVEDRLHQPVEIALDPGELLLLGAALIVRSRIEARIVARRVSSSRR